jgi:hypothetical protein
MQNFVDNFTIGLEECVAASGNFLNYCLIRWDHGVLEDSPVSPSHISSKSMGLYCKQRMQFWMSLMNILEIELSQIASLDVLAMNGLAIRFSPPQSV